MAQYRLNAYDADVFIPEFKGLYQYGDQMGSDLRYSPDCVNVETPGGVLQPAVKHKEISVYSDPSHSQMIPTYENACMMAAEITNCFQTAYNGSVIGYRDNQNYIKVQEVISSGSKFNLYLLIIGKYAYEIVLNVGQEDQYGNLTYLGHAVSGISANQIKEFNYEDDWSWCTYEHDFGEGETGQPSGRTNILVLNSEKNGTFIYSKPGDISELGVLVPQLKHISRYSERLWGVGTGNDKDTIYYSRAFNINDWSPAGQDEQPEVGGGEIRLATFDNDKINALIPFADSLIAFSDQRAWKITGSDPSSFYIQEQYGNGTKYPKTAVVMDERIIMLTNRGLVSYDGSTVSPFLQEYTHDLFYERLDYWNGAPPVAVCYGSKYILALCNKIEQTQPGTIINNGFISLVYDKKDGSVTLVDAPLVKDLLRYGDYSFALYSTATTVYIGQIHSDSFALQEIVPYGTKWVTPWIDLGRKDIQKGGFELYFYPELNTDEVGASVTLKFSIQTEKKTKTKNYVVHSLTEAEKAAGKKYKHKRLHFGGSGRRFRLMIETEAGNTIPWRLIGGVHIIAETDAD